MFNRIIAGAALTVAALSGPMSAETLRFSSFEPPVAFLTAKVFPAWAERVAEATNGDVTIEMFPGGTLGRSPAQQLKLVADGVADIAFVVPGYNPGVFPGVTVGELPFVVNSSEAGSKAMWSVYEQGLLEGAFDNYYIVGLFTTTPSSIATVEPVMMPEDTKGMNLRGSSPTLLASIEAIGGVAVGGIAAPTIAESISRGVIEGSFNEWNALKSFRIQEVVNHVLEVPMGTSPLMVVMNKARYEGLSEEARMAIDAVSGAAFAEAFGKAFDEEAGSARAAAIDEGRLSIVNPDQAALDAWRIASAPSIEGWLAEGPGRHALLDAFTAALDE